MKYFVPLLYILLVVSCASTSRTSQPLSCPQIFVAQPFANLTLLADLREGQHSLSFAKVQALCQADATTNLLKLSFTLQLDKPLSEEQRQKSLLIPLFAVLTQDGKTVASRRSQRLETTFDKKGRAEVSWLVALPATLFPSPDITPASILYLGFEGKNAYIRNLRRKP